MARSSLALRVFVTGTAAFFLLPFCQLSFVNVARPTTQAHTLLRASSAEDYPELSRVENLIYESCVLKEGAQEMQCLSTWDKLQNFHKEAKLECNLEDLRCVVLDVLDRICGNIKGQEGLIVLSKVANTMQSFRKKFNDWDKAFTDADTDGSGDLSMAELSAAINKMDVGLTEKEVSIVFMAADANGDGKVSKMEFSDFMTAAVFAEEPLSQISVDAPPKEKVDLDTEDLLRWSSTGASWMGAR